MGFSLLGDRNHPFCNEKSRRPKSDLSSASTFWTSSGEQCSTLQKQNILQQFRKREEAIQKRREEAKAEVSKYEESLSLIRSKKAEYLQTASRVPEPLRGVTFSETTLRSAVKSITWRVVAGSVTLVTSLRFSGSLATALQVVGADFFSKGFTMFLGERLMNKSQAGRKAGSDGIRRSIAKALIWRLFAIANTLVMAVFVSKDWSVASKIASTDALFKTMLMFFYERIWTRIGWGKQYLPELAKALPAADTAQEFSERLHNYMLAGR